MRRPHLHGIALGGLQERLGDGRNPAAFVQLRARLIDPDDPYRFRFTGLGPVADGGAEMATVPVLSTRRIDDLGDLHTFAQEPHAPVDLAQAPFAVDIISVL